MKITFCVIYYNQEKYVEDSINSILSITKNIDFEILVGDDGSQDKTIDKVKKFQTLLGEKLKIYTMSRDKNIKYNSIHRSSNNRLNLIQHSTGDYIMFLDGDDYYCDKNFLIQAIDKFNIYNELVAVGFRYKNVFLNREEIPKNKLAQGLIKAKDYIKKAYIPSGAFVFRNIFKNKYSLLVDNGFFDDNLITIFALQYGKIYYFDRVVYAYRQLDNSTWNSYDDLQRNLINVFDIAYISNIAPSFKKNLFIRNFGAIKFLFYKRKELLKLFEEAKYKNLKDEIEIIKNFKIYKIINYSNLCILDKISLTIWFYSFKTFKRFL
ncbi:TPA: glycosyltransferase family 2 protein [Campylobacter coli]|nr:glycosyltransferase family 2 protein [Campylobacter coli]